MGICKEETGGMMSKIIMVVCLMCLSGCFTPDKVDKAQQDYVCSKKGGVNVYVRYSGNLSNKVQCMDGSYQEWIRVVIPTK